MPIIMTNTTTTFRISFGKDTAPAVARSLVNALRRVCLTDVPSLAIPFAPYACDGNGGGVRHGVEVFANTSCMHNELLAHRLCLAPIHASPDEVEAFASGQRALPIIRLEVAHPADAWTSRDVTTADLQVLVDEDDAESAKAATGWFPANLVTGDHVLLAVLKPGQEIALEARPEVGTARRHAAWAPASVATFAPVVKGSSRGITYEFTLEGVSQTPGDIVRVAWQRLRARFESAAKCFASRDRATVGVKEDNGGDDGNDTLVVWQARLDDEDHTVAHPLQTWLHEHIALTRGCSANQGTSDGMVAAGYYVAHPLERTILVQMAYKRGADVTEERVRRALAAACTALAEEAADKLLQQQLQCA
jgi:DNA-directed RNA polymerase subunit L